jgi:hypothetical protein
MQLNDDFNATWVRLGYSLSITNPSQSSATDLSQRYRVHDWLHAAPRVSLVAGKRRINFLTHDLSHATLMTTYGHEYLLDGTPSGLVC